MTRNACLTNRHCSRSPAGSTVWHHSMSGHYEGQHVKSDVSELQQGEWVAPPMTVKLPNNTGYASITRGGASSTTRGWRWNATASAASRSASGHRQPVSHPYELRYSKEDIARLASPRRSPARSLRRGASS